jgi:hypothetical protein
MISNKKADAYNKPRNPLPPATTNLLAAMLMLLIAPGMISLVQANWNLNNGLLTLAIEGPEVTQKIC